LTKLISLINRALSSREGAAIQRDRAFVWERIWDSLAIH